MKKRILMLLSVAVVMATMVLATAMSALAQGNPQPNQGKADPPTENAQHGCNGFAHTPTNEPPFFQSSHVTC
jgi:hypothetical protein